MHNSPIFVAPPHLKFPDAGPPPIPFNETTELLRQLLDVQKEQLILSRNQAVANDNASRWRNFLAKWQEEFPNVGQACKEVLPTFERVYLRLIQDMTDRLRGDEPDDLDSEFTLAEFLDRYGMRISQLGAIIGQISPLADAAPTPPTPSEEPNG